MKYLLLVCVLFTLDTNVAGRLSGLLSTQSPVFLRPEQQTSIEFGFSLSLYTNETHRNLLIGAPSANTSQQGVTSPGALYSCNLLEKGSEISCSQLEVDTRDVDDNYVSFIDTDMKDFQRLGGSLATYGDNVLVCAPNWHYYEKRVSLTIDAPVGMCFLSHSLEKFEPFSVPYDLTKGFNIAYLDSGSCQSGFSSYISKDNSILLGAPGCFNWEGDVFATAPTDFTSFGKSFMASDVGGSKEDQDIWLSNMYMGYSIGGGEFKGQSGVAVGMPRSAQLNDQIYVSSKENLEVMNPMVTIHLVQKMSLKIWTILTPPKNDRGSFDSVWLFSYFGYSLTVADIDGNGLDDVIVGAPFYYNFTHFDQGAILVYLQRESKNDGDSQNYDNYYISLEKNKLLRMGTVDYERFGSCVSSVGDLDGDGIGDIAVGAPYGEDGGRVYIYLGSQNGLSEVPSQTLHATDDALKDRNLKGFGSSFASFFQMKEGTQNDLAIGAFTSDTVVLFRSKVMIDVKWEVKFPQKMDLSSKCQFENKEIPCSKIVTCLSYSFLENGKKGDTRPKEFTLSYSLDINASPKRLFFANSKTFQSSRVFVEFEKINCYPQTVFTNRRIYDLDAFEIRSAIVHVPGLIGDESALKTDQKTTSIDALEIKFECVSPDVSGCVSDLHLQTETSASAVRVEDAQFRILFEITNFGESSYSNKLELFMDPFLDISGKAEIEEGSTISPTIDCKVVGEGRSQCSLGTFINTNEVLKFSLSIVTTESFLKIENLRNHDAKFEVNSSLTTVSDIKFPDAARTYNVILLETQPIVFLTRNESSTDLVTLKKDFEYKYSSETDEEKEVGPLITHIYEIYNKMSYAIQNNDIRVYWPYTINGVDFLDGKVRLSVPSESCKSSLQVGYVRDDGRNLSTFGEVVWKVTSCILLYLEPQESVDVQLDLRLVMKTLIEEIYNPDFDEIRSYVKLDSTPVLLGEQVKRVVSNHIQTRINYGDFVFKLVPNWVYILGGVIGIAVFILVICCLRKCNFFKRKKTQNFSQEDLADGEAEEGEEAQETNTMIPASEEEEYDNV